MTMNSKRAISGDQLLDASGNNCNINAASGTWYADVASDHYGELLEVILRAGTLKKDGSSAAGTLATIRVVVVQGRGNTAVTAATAKAEHVLFDSGTITSPTPSTTTAFMRETFAGASGDAQPYSRGMRVLVDWTATGGTYDREMHIALGYRESR